MPYIGNSPEHITTGQKVVYKYIATAGQTVFTGTDASSNPLTITSKDTIDVFYNGVRLINVDDYTRTTDQVTLVATSTVGDEIIIISIASFQDADHYTKLEVDGVVNTSISDLIDTAPATLNTLNELAAAIGDDPSHVATMTTLIDTKLSLTGGSITGNLGIGTSVPTTLLHVQAASLSTESLITFDRSDGAVKGEIKYDEPDATRGFQIGTTTQHDFALKTHDTTRLQIKYDGKVGIGTTAPTTKFNVYESSTGATSSRSINPNSAGQADFFAESDVGICGPLAYGSTRADYGSIGAGEAGLYSNRNVTIMSDTGAGIIKFATGGNTERMRITSSGNVGIGTNSPSAKLDIKATGGGAGLTLRTTDAAGNENFFIMDGGRTGVRYYPFTVGIPSSAITSNVFEINAAGANFSVDTSGNVNIGGTVNANAFVGDGSGLTGVASTLDSLTDCTISAAIPTINTNPSAVGHLWIEEDTGDIYICTDATTGANYWKNQSGGMDVTPSTVSTFDIFGDGSARTLYQLDGNANDTGGSYNATIVGSVNWDTGKFGLCYSNNGSNKYILAPRIFDTNFSWSVWVKFNSTNGSRFFGVESGSISDDLVIQSNGGHIQAYVSSVGSVTIKTNFSTGVWYHIVAVKGVGFYLDGSLAVSVPSMVQPGSGGYMGIGVDGADYGEVGYLDGKLDQIRMFNKVLSAAEVLTLYNES
jgi:hypothetical protein